MYCTSFQQTTEHACFLRYLSLLHHSNYFIVDDKKEDKSTANKLSALLKNVEAKVIQDVARRFVPKEVHNDIVQSLQDQLAAALAKLPKQSLSVPQAVRLRPNSPVPPILQITESTSVATKDAFRRLEADYRKLLSESNDLQREYERILEINNDFTQILSKLTMVQMEHYQMLAGGAGKESEAADTTDGDTISNLEAKAEEYKQQAEELRFKLDDITRELQERDKQLHKVREDERRMRKKLQLSADATDDEVNAKLTQLLKNATANAEVTKMQRDLQRLAEERTTLESTIIQLERDKELTSFKLRQTELQLRQVFCRQKARPLFSRMSNSLAQRQFMFPLIDSPRLTARQPNAITNGNTGNAQKNFCIFCQSDAYNGKSCRIHYKAFRDKWTCCNEPLHRGAGCIKVPHCYIIKSDYLFITDGSQYMKLAV